MTKTKTYCVHIYKRADVEYVESIKAKNPQEAELKAIAQRGGDYDGIHSVEVMRECSCGTDNDLDEKRCQNCNKKL